ncbi:unnamed protein product [Phaedon cochleariae]|uniref:Allatotropin n=1 Tax=Phaedon cochleariae TaxID=80249 RepID=A0A9P0DTV8_PHACE|nr:unnamed protein product [Phaedon cochleariae]
MAFHQIILLFTIIFLWHILANAQDSMENREGYFSPGKPRHLFLHQPQRSTRKISQRAFQDMDLFTARGYGKRGSECFGNTCGKRIPAFSGARLYGKRNIDMNQLKCLFVDCGDLDKHLRITDEITNRKFRSDEDVFTD